MYFKFPYTIKKSQCHLHHSSLEFNGDLLHSQNSVLGAKNPKDNWFLRNTLEIVIFCPHIGIKILNSPFYEI